MKALLIIDMQKGSFTPETPRFDTEKVIERINLLSDFFRKNTEPVIFIQHDGSRHNCYQPGTEDWELLPSLKIEKKDFVLAKTANDAFYKTTLDTELRKLGIDELVITGCATEFCINSTVCSAINHDYSVTIIEDAHTTANRPHLSAEKVIEHYNWVWPEMIPTEGTIQVRSCERFLNDNY